ncbi:hypothetical protein A3I50_02315 [Candidatus Roizmanbacteria bacterium RIFCSPLOWO2_02_FULL_37_9]|nr:MAG: hypothetical protein A3I50_02315 [Candidatus Roizmanbacteria bacterium RIFCSPLOWO2_02_FULL_37_9]
MSKRVKFLIAVGIFLAAVLISLVLLWFRPPVKNNSTSSSSKITNETKVNNNTGSLSFIESLRQRDYEASQIKIEETLSNNSSYSSYTVFYLSDGLKIYARMNIPLGDGPFPVILLNHGYFNTMSFTSGDGTQAMADILARNGYLTLASDYRGFGKSENDGQGSRGHRPEYAIDVLNLIASVKNLEKANAEKIGMWGHAMGGEVALRVAEATDKVEAVVLWAPTSARSEDNLRFYSRRHTSATPNQQVSDGSSPIDYLHYIQAPISLHQGLSDTEVNPEWSKQLSEALAKEGKIVEYFEYEGQDHNFRNLGWDVISKRTVEFFNKYLK